MVRATPVDSGVLFDCVGEDGDVGRGVVIAYVGNVPCVQFWGDIGKAGLRGAQAPCWYPDDGEGYYVAREKRDKKDTPFTIAVKVTLLKCTFDWPRDNKIPSGLLKEHFPDV